MDYTFTEKETEMMFNWGYTSEIEHGFEAEEQKLYDKLERIFTPLQRFVDIDKDLCFDTKKTKYTDVVLEVSKMINKLKLKKREAK